MPMPNWQIGSLLVNCFSRFDPIVKRRLNELFIQKVIDQVIWDMIQEGVFPKWFQDAFSFDSIHGELNGLRESLIDASKDWLIVINDNKYHLIDFSDAELAGMAAHVGLSDAEVQKVGRELNNRLAGAN